MVESPSAAWTLGMTIEAKADAAAIWPTRSPSCRREMGVFSIGFMRFSLDDLESGPEELTLRLRRPHSHWAGTRECRHVDMYRTVGRVFQTVFGPGFDGPDAAESLWRISATIEPHCPPAATTFNVWIWSPATLTSCRAF